MRRRTSRHDGRGSVARSWHLCAPGKPLICRSSRNGIAGNSSGRGPRARSHGALRSCRHPLFGRRTDARAGPRGTAATARPLDPERCSRRCTGCAMGHGTWPGEHPRTPVPRRSASAHAARAPLGAGRAYPPATHIVFCAGKACTCGTCSLCGAYADTSDARFACQHCAATPTDSHAACMASPSVWPWRPNRRCRASRLGKIKQASVRLLL